MNLKVLYDDKHESPGSKLARADLLGFPIQIIIGPRGIKEGSIDIKERCSNKIMKLKITDMYKYIENFCSK